MDEITLIRAIMLLGKNKQFETGSTSKAIILLNQYNKERDEQLVEGLAKWAACMSDRQWELAEEEMGPNSKKLWRQETRTAITKARNESKTDKDSLLADPTLHESPGAACSPLTSEHIICGKCEKIVCENHCEKDGECQEEQSSIARIHKILDDEEARLKENKLLHADSLATIRKIREML